MEQQDTLPYNIEADAAMAFHIGCKDFMKSPVATTLEDEKLQLIRGLPLQLSSSVSVIDAAREPPTNTAAAAATAALAAEETLCDTLVDPPEMEASEAASTGDMQTLNSGNEGKHPTQTCEDQGQTKAAVDIPPAQEDAAEIPPAHPEGQEEMDAPEIRPAQWEGREEMKDAPEIRPVHPEGQEEMDAVIRSVHLEGEQEMKDAAEIRPVHPEGQEETNAASPGNILPEHAKDAEDPVETKHAQTIPCPTTAGHAGEGSPATQHYSQGESSTAAEEEDCVEEETVHLQAAMKRPSILDTLTPISPEEQSKLAAVHTEDAGEDEEDEDGCPKKARGRSKGRGSQRGRGRGRGRGKMSRKRAVCKGQSTKGKRTRANTSWDEDSEALAPASTCRRLAAGSPKNAKRKTPASIDDPMAGKAPGKPKGRAAAKAKGAAKRAAKRLREPSPDPVEDEESDAGDDMDGVDDDDCVSGAASPARTVSEFGPQSEDDGNESADESADDIPRVPKRNPTPKAKATAKAKAKAKAKAAPKAKATVKARATAKAKAKAKGRPRKSSIADAQAEAKARLSRKSSAYHKARAAARAAGKSEAEAKQEASQVSCARNLIACNCPSTLGVLWYYNLIIYTYII